MTRFTTVCLAFALVVMTSGAQAGDVAPAATETGASIGAGVGAIVGNTIDGISRGIEAARAPKETVVIDRRTVVKPVPARPCVRTAEGTRVCEGD